MKKIISLIISVFLFFIISYTVSANQLEMKAVEGFSKEAPLSYSEEKFYIYGHKCGTDCDSYGRNCKKGIYIAKGLTCSILHISCD